jgi:hypothetical protein
VFSQSRDIYVYLQAYEQGLPSFQPLIAFVSFYQAEKKSFETPPIEVTSGTNNRVKTMPLNFRFPLHQLSPGKYECQVTVLDPAGQKTAFWRAPVMLVP